MPISRAKKATATRAAILEAAKRRFTAEGFEASLSSIVEDAGITKGALFHHFENKQALYREVWRDLQQEMGRDTQEAAMAARSADDPFKAILAGCRRYLEWATRPDFQRIVLIEGRGAMGMSGWMASDVEVGRQTIGGAVGYLVERGYVDEERAATVAVIILGALHGGGIALSRQRPGVTVDSICEEFERMLRRMN